jgi:citryl-CoA lyase
MVNDLTFTTKISGHTPDGLELRGHSLSSLVEKGDFVGALFLSIQGRPATADETFMLNAILTASIDHGIEPASGFVPRVVAASGNEIKTAMASSLLALGEYHGGAVSAAMKTMQEVLSHSQEHGGDLEKSCIEIATTYRQRKQVVSGFGHAIYKTEDPRAQQLIRLAREHHLKNEYLNISEMLEHALETVIGKKLVLNIDGALAAVLLSMHFSPTVGNAIFALARVGGSIAHILEEIEQGNRVRRLSESDVSYQP